MYDVAIIGAGVVGASIGRELSRYALNVVLIEKEMDVSGGITKGNTAILHSGYNTKPGTLKAQLCQMGNPLIAKACKELEVPYKRVGSLLIAFDEVGVEKVYDNYHRGLNNGVKGLKILKKQEVLDIEPHLNDKAVGEVSLFAPTTGIICPWELTIALVENAVDNGVTLKLDHKVNRIDKVENGYIITTPNEEITSQYIINCAGLFADEIHNMVSVPTFKINPKRGEYYILDKNIGQLFNHIIFQAKDKVTKGVNITPTIHGNWLIGPSAEEVDDKEAVNTTMEKLELLQKGALLTGNDIPFDKTIKTFATLRPKLHVLEHSKEQEDLGDFLIEESKEAPGFINVAGIKSPGITAAPAIAKYVIQILKDIEGEEFKTNPAFNPYRKGFENFMDLSDAEKALWIQKDPRYGHVVCRCQGITEGEIIDAIHRNAGATTLDGVKKRVTTSMGRCQGSFCSPKIMKILARELNKKPDEILKDSKGSYIITDAKENECI